MFETAAGYKTDDRCVSISLLGRISRVRQDRADLIAENREVRPTWIVAFAGTDSSEWTPRLRGRQYRIVSSSVASAPAPVSCKMLLVSGRWTEGGSVAVRGLAARPFSLAWMAYADVVMPYHVGPS